MFLVLTKNDLVEFTKEPITSEMLHEKEKTMDFEGAFSTSTLEEKSESVHTAFVKAIALTYYHKYEEELYAESSHSK